MRFRYLLEYQGSINIAAKVHTLTPGNEFYSLIMAAMRTADGDNYAKLAEAFPDVERELVAMYHTPGAIIQE